VNTELEVLRDVVARLESAAIPYMLTGSVAMSVYVEPRLTRDIDIVAELASEHASRITQLFSPDYYVSEEAVQAAIEGGTLFNVFHLAHLVKVDLIVRKDDEFQRHSFARRKRWDIGGNATTWVISKEDLVLSKLLWAAASESAVQLADVRKLLASGVDETYLRGWSARLGVDGLLRKCVDAGHIP